MTVTLNDIAQQVGVRISTVSRVLNNKPNPIRISEATKRKILQAAREMGYHPNAAARSLSTKRTGHIGFILSDDIAGGLTNNFFASYLAGVEQACRRRGYGLNVCLYNLSNVNTFVFPSRVGQRSVDGLVLAGYVAESIVARFSEFGIPCVGLGQDTELTGLVPTVAVDDVEGLILGVRHVYGLGHRQVLLHKSPRRRGREVVRQVKDRVKNDAILKDCQILVKEPSSGNCDFYSAPELFQFWRDLPADQRPTVIFASDQTLVCLLREMDKQGLQCPRDVSLISISDTLLCEYARPALTALNFDLADHGRIAVDLLVDHLEGKNNLDSSLSINDLPCTLVERESTKKISDL